MKGIVYCLEFKVGENKILENDVDQVLDYALDLKNFHKFSEDRIIVPMLVATDYKSRSSFIQKSVYEDKVVNPLVTGTEGIGILMKNVINHPHLQLSRLQELYMKITRWKTSQDTRQIRFQQMKLLLVYWILSAKAKLIMRKAFAL